MLNNDKNERNWVLTSSEKDSDTAVNHDTLFHGESLLVVTAGDSEGVSLEFLAKDDSVDIRAHSSVVEVATKYY